MKKNILLPLTTLFIMGVTLAGCHQPKATQNNNAKKHDTAVVKNIAASKIDTLIFTDPQLSALVQQTYRFFTVFDTVGIFGDHDIRLFKFTPLELKALRGSIAPGEAATDTMTGASITSNLSTMIADNLVKILSWKDIDNYDLTLLLKGHLGALRSPDGKLYNFSFDERTGGTYHSCISLVHYNPGGGKPTLSYQAGDVFNKDGYDSIDTIMTKKGLRYILSGSVIGCTTCVGNYIDMVHFEKDRFVSDFDYTVAIRTSRDYEENDDAPTIAYDAQKHTISIKYFTNDQTTDCNCGPTGSIGADSLVSAGDEPAPQMVTCLYALKDSKFKLKKSSVITATPIKN